MNVIKQTSVTIVHTDSLPETKTGFENFVQSVENQTGKKFLKVECDKEAVHFYFR